MPVLARLCIAVNVAAAFACLGLVACGLIAGDQGGRLLALIGISQLMPYYLGAKAASGFRDSVTLAVLLAASIVAVAVCLYVDYAALELVLRHQGAGHQPAADGPSWADWLGRIGMVLVIFVLPVVQLAIIFIPLVFVWLAKSLWKTAEGAGPPG